MANEFDHGCDASFSSMPFICPACRHAFLPKTCTGIIICPECRIPIDLDATEEEE